MSTQRDSYSGFQKNNKTGYKQPKGRSDNSRYYNRGGQRKNSSRLETLGSLSDVPKKTFNAPPPIIHHVRKDSYSREASSQATSWRNPIQHSEDTTEDDKTKKLDCQQSTSSSSGSVWNVPSKEALNVPKDMDDFPALDVEPNCMNKKSTNKQILNTPDDNESTLENIKKLLTEIQNSPPLLVYLQEYLQDPEVFNFKTDGTILTPSLHSLELISKGLKNIAVSSTSCLGRINESKSLGNDMKTELQEANNSSIHLTHMPANVSSDSFDSSKNFKNNEFPKQNVIFKIKKREPPVTMNSQATNSRKEVDVTPAKCTPTNVSCTYNEIDKSVKNTQEKIDQTRLFERVSSLKVKDSSYTLSQPDKIPSSSSNKNIVKKPVIHVYDVPTGKKTETRNEKTFEETNTMKPNDDFGGRTKVVNSDDVKNERKNIGDLPSPYKRVEDAIKSFRICAKPTDFVYEGSEKFENNFIGTIRETPILTVSERIKVSYPKKTSQNKLPHNHNKHQNDKHSYARSDVSKTTNQEKNEKEIRRNKLVITVSDRNIENNSKSQSVTEVTSKQISCSISDKCESSGANSIVMGTNESIRPTDVEKILDLEICNTNSVNCNIYSENGEKLNEINSDFECQNASEEPHSVNTFGSSNQQDLSYSGQFHPLKREMLSMIHGTPFNFSSQVNRSNTFPYSDISEMSNIIPCVSSQQYVWHGFPPVDGQRCTQPNYSNLHMSYPISSMGYSGRFSGISGDYPITSRPMSHRTMSYSGHYYEYDSTQSSNYQNYLQALPNQYWIQNSFKRPE